MAEAADVTVQQLFKKWRSGDAEAGQTMAQRFSDWYYAIAAVHLGDRKGRAPLDRACQAFAQGIINIHRPGDLVEWAYALIQQELLSAKEQLSSGGRIVGVDSGNALTGNRAPSRLLREVRGNLDPDQVQLLHLLYTGSTDVEAIERLAEPQGGMPVAALRARYTLKRLLRSNANVNFQETPLELNFDRSPLTYYEADRLTSNEENEAFEKWLLSDALVCRDVAEFAAFTHALRAGLLLSDDEPEVQQVSAPAPAPAPPPSGRPEPMLVRPDNVESKPAETRPSGNMPMIIGAVVVGLIIVAALAAFLLKG